MPTTYYYSETQTKNSKEFKSKREAIKAAEKKADRDWRPVDLWHANIQGNHVSEGMEGYVLPKHVSKKVKLLKLS